MLRYHKPFVPERLHRTITWFACQIAGTHLNGGGIRGASFNTPPWPFACCEWPHGRVLPDPNYTCAQLHTNGNAEDNLLSMDLPLIPCRGSSTCLRRSETSRAYQTHRILNNGGLHATCVDIPIEPVYGNPKCARRPDAIRTTRRTGSYTLDVFTHQVTRCRVDWSPPPRFGLSLDQDETEDQSPHRLWDWSPRGARSLRPPKPLKN